MSVQSTSLLSDRVALHSRWLICCRCCVWQTEQCVNFARDGVCPYGPRCRFIHNLSTLDHDSLPGLGPVSSLQHAILSDPQLPPYLQQQQHQPAVQTQQSTSQATGSGPAAAASESYSPRFPTTPSSVQPAFSPLNSSARLADFSLPFSRGTRTLSNSSAQSSSAHLTPPQQPSHAAASLVSSLGRHRSESAASSSSASASPSYPALLGSSGLSPASSTLYSPFSASSNSRLSPIDRPAPSPTSSLPSSASSTSSISRPSSADEHDRLAASAHQPLSKAHRPIPVSRQQQQQHQHQSHSHHLQYSQHQTVQQSTQQQHQEHLHRRQSQQARQPAQYQYHTSQRHSIPVDDDESAFDAVDLGSVDVLSLNSLMDDDDENDNALPSRSLIASQHASMQQQQQLLQSQRYQLQARRMGGSEGSVEHLSPPMTALHALHSQSIGHPLRSAGTADDDAGKEGHDDEKQSGSHSPSRRTSAVSPWTSVATSTLAVLSPASQASPMLRGVSPSSLRTTSPLQAPATFSSMSASSQSAYGLHWSDRSASFSGVGQPSSVVSTSRSSSFAATNSPFLSHSPFSSSPFSPFTASALPSTPFELPRAALPPSSPALSSASSGSSASSTTQAQHPHAHYAGYHSGAGSGSGSGPRQHRGSVDMQLQDEAEDDLAQHDQHDQHQQQHRHSTAAAAATTSSPWLSSSSLHIIDDSAAASPRVAFQSRNPSPLR